MKSYLALIICFLFFVKAVFAWNPAGQCVVHLDKSFYVTGEVIWFKIYLPPASKGNPFTLRVALLDGQGEVADYFFLKTEGKTFVNGYYKIPFDSESGIYHLAFLAQEQASKRPVILAKVPVPVYNDLKKLNNIEITKSSSIMESPNAFKNNELQVEVALDQDTYKNRETIQPIITVKDQTGQPVKANISVAVTDIALAGSSVLTYSTLSAGLPLVSAALNDQIYTQTKLSGSSVGTQKENLIGIYDPVEWQMFYASPDEEGVFFIEIPHFYGEKSIQFLGYPNPDIQIQMNEVLKVSHSSSLIYTEGILKYLELSRQRKKIFQLYTALETSLSPEVSEDKSQPLAPDRSILPGNYENFEDLATFFREISSPLAFTLDRKKNMYTARMYNPGIQTYYPNDPMFIVDGQVTRSADFVARLKSTDVERVDLYYNFDKLFSNFLVIGSSGVINITTKSGVKIPEPEAEDIIFINGLQAPAKFPEFRPEQIGNNKHQPFFRPQLYWNPTITTDANGQASFSFVQSDDISTFRIEVVVQAEDGSIGQASKEYIVNW